MTAKDNLKEMRIVEFLGDGEKFGSPRKHSNQFPNSLEAMRQ